MAKESIYKQRLAAFAKSQGLSMRGLSLKIGLEENSVCKGRGEMTTKTIRHIFRTYPDINLYWLLFGEGDNMLIDNEESSSMAASKFVFNEYHKLQVENRQLIAENAVLKVQLNDALRKIEELSGKSDEEKSVKIE